MKKHYKIEVYNYEEQKWWSRFANHKNFSSLDDARQQLNVYDAPTRIIEVSETVAETRNFLSREDLEKLLKDHPILVFENCDMYRIYSVHPTQGEFKLLTPKVCSVWIFSLDEAYIANGKLSIKDITEKRVEFAYYKNVLL